MNGYIFNPGEKFVGSDEYKIEKGIGKGQFAEVYLARAKRTGQLVALKCFTDDNLSYNDLLDEAFKMVAFQACPYIVTIIDVRPHELYPFLVMEYMEGGTLRGKINHMVYNEGQSHLDPHQAANIVWQLCRAVRAMHQKDIVHCDIKPENVFLRIVDDEVKLGDLGCSIYLKDERNRILAGSPSYMAPELALEAKLAPGSDIYSLGVVLFELLIGRLPLGFMDADTWSEIVKQQPDQARIEWPTDVSQPVPAKLKDVVLKATAFESDDRYRSIDHMLNDIAIFLHGEYLAASPTITPIDSFDSEVLMGSTDPVNAMIDRMRRDRDNDENRLLSYSEAFQRRQVEIVDRLTDDMKGVIYAAFHQSCDLKNLYVGLEHVFFILSTRKGSQLRRILDERGINAREFGLQISDQFKVMVNLEGRAVLSPRLERVLERAKAQCKGSVGEKAFLEQALKENCFVTMLMNQMGDMKMPARDIAGCEILIGPKDGEFWEISSQEMKIGRDHHVNDAWVFWDNRVTRRPGHAKLVRKQDGGYGILDLNSAYGTTVLGRCSLGKQGSEETFIPANEETVLTSGEIVVVGNTWLRFVG